MSNGFVVTLLKDIPLCVWKGLTKTSTKHNYIYFVTYVVTIEVHVSAQNDRQALCKNTERKRKLKCCLYILTVSPHKVLTIFNCIKLPRRRVQLEIVHVFEISHFHVWLCFVL
jgi:hypothetical protein